MAALGPEGLTCRPSRPLTENTFVPGSEGGHEKHTLGNRPGALMVPYPHSMPQFLHPDATKSDKVFLRGGSEEQGAEEVWKCKGGRNQEFRHGNQ